MGNGLDIAPPPKKKTPPPAAAEEAVKTKPVAQKKASERKPRPSVKFDKQAETEKTQFNKRVTRRTADTFDMLAIKTRRKVPELLAEAAELLEQKYGKV